MTFGLFAGQIYLFLDVVYKSKFLVFRKKAKTTRRKQSNRNTCRKRNTRRKQSNRNTRHTLKHEATPVQENDRPRGKRRRGVMKTMSLSLSILLKLGLLGLLVGGIGLVGKGHQKVKLISKQISQAVENSPLKLNKTMSPESQFDSELFDLIFKIIFKSLRSL